MPQRTVEVAVTAQMSNYLAGMQRGSAATAGLGKQAQTTGQLTQEFVGKVGNSISKLGSTVGGTVGLILNTVGDDLDKIAGKSAHLSTALQVGGGAAVAAGLGLEQLGSGAVQATDQLNAAITASGEAVSDYSKKIEEAVASNEDLGHSAEDTKAALTVLIPAAGSTSKALAQMQVVADLAAAKHESLATAATAVARILGGNGSRTLSVYGIHMDGVGTKTQQADRALAQLSEKLNGQASASVDNFSGQVGILTTKIGDFINEAAGPTGIAFQVIGGAAAATGVILDIYNSRLEIAKAKQIALAAATEAGTVAITAEGLSSAAAGVTMGGFSAKVAALASGPLGIAAIGVGALYAVDGLLSLADAAENNKLAFADAAGAAKAYNQQVAAGALISTTPKVNRENILGQVAGASSGLAAWEQKNLGPIGDITIFATGYKQASESVDKIDASMAKLVASGHAKEAAAEFAKWKDAAKSDGVSLSDLNDKFPGYTAALAAYGATATTSTASTADLGAKFSVTAQNAANLKTTTDELEKSLSTYGSTAQTAEGATEGYYNALDAANKSIKDNGKNIDDSTVKGRANNQTLYALAKSADDLAAANLKAKVPIDQVKASLDQQRATFVQVAQNMGYTAQAAQDLAAKLIGVTTTKYNFTLDGVTVATNSLNEYIKALNKIPGSVTTSFVLNHSRTNASANGNMFDYGGRAATFANGGFPTGIYAGRAGGIHKFAEPETGWELYVSGKKSERARNQSLLMQGAARLGMLGAPAPVYQSAPQMSGGNTTVIQVTVPVSQSLIGNDDFIAKSLVTKIQQGLKSGVVPVNWNSN